MTSTPTIARPNSEYIGELDRQAIKWAKFVKQNPVMKFVAWSKQKQVIQADYETRLLAWANRTGKTTIGACECVLAGMGMHRYVDYAEPPFTIWACSIDYKQMQDSIMPAFEGDGTHPRMLPKGTVWNDNKKTYTLPFPEHLKKRDANGRKLPGEDERRGSIIRLKSADSGRKAFQGAMLPLIWLDEELPDDIIKEILIRIGPKKRRIFWTMTAVGGLSYAYDHFYVPWLAWPDEHEGEAHPRIFYSEAAIDENPHNNKEDIANLADKYPAESKELKVRMGGGFRDMTADSIFSDEAIAHHKANCIEAPETVLLSCDFKSRKSPIIVTPVADNISMKGLELSVQVWERPNRLYDYAIGIDPNEGKLSDKTNDDSPRDFAYMCVINRTLKRYVARYHGRCDPHTLGELGWMLGMWYNYAWIGMEINSMGVATLGTFTGKTRIPVYGRLYQRRTDFDEWSEQISPDDLGWRTMTNTRGKLVSELFTLLERDRESGLYLFYLPDILVVKEMMAFQKNKDGKPEAIRGRNDDSIFGLGIGNQVDIACPTGRQKEISKQTGKATRKSGFKQYMVEGGKREV